MCVLVLWSVCCAVQSEFRLAQAHPDEFAWVFAHRSARTLRGAVAAAVLGSGVAHLENSWV